MIDLKLRWFADDDPADDTPGDDTPADDTPAADPVDVPDVPGVGGVLTAWLETLGDTSVVLRATYKEVRSSLDHGWIVGLFDGAGKCTFVTEASVDETGDTPVYVVKDAAGNEYDASSEDGQPVLQSVIDNGGVV